MDDQNLRKRYDAEVASKAMTIMAEQVAVRKLQKEGAANPWKKPEEGENDGEADR